MSIFPGVLIVHLFVPKGPMRSHALASGERKAMHAVVQWRANHLVVLALLQPRFLAVPAEKVEGCEAAVAAVEDWSVMA